MTIGAFVLGPEVMHVLYGGGFDARAAISRCSRLGAGGYLGRPDPVASRAGSRRGGGRRRGLGRFGRRCSSALELMLGGAALHRVAVAFCVAALANAGAFWLLSARARA